MDHGDDHGVFEGSGRDSIRGIPTAVDGALRERARAAGKSLNEAAVEALAEGSGLAGARRKRRDLADIARTWKAEKAVDAALADQDVLVLKAKRDRL